MTDELSARIEELKNYDGTFEQKLSGMKEALDAVEKEYNASWKNNVFDFIRFQTKFNAMKEKLK